MPIFKIGDEYADIDFELLSRHLQLLDVEIAEINAAIKKSSDPESDGLFDSGEYFIGNGFVAVQRYLTSTRAGLGISQSVAFSVPPMVKGNVPLAEILNAGANYWKHMEEWIEVINRPEEEDLKGNALRTLEKLEKVTPWKDYTCANLLAILVEGREFALSPLLSGLAEWRNNLMSLPSAR
jgi:hypothetical protein